MANEVASEFHEQRIRASREPDGPSRPKQKPFECRTVQECGDEDNQGVAAFAHPTPGLNSSHGMKDPIVGYTWQ